MKVSKYCTSCYESFVNPYSLKCGHTFCEDCWLQYLIAKITTGINCCEANCPQAGCNMTVTHTAFTKILASQPKHLDRYWRNLCKSFCETDRNFRWCSKKGCEFAFQLQLYSVQTTIMCKCGYETCLSCGHERHSPCYCNIVAQWDKKSSAESENLTWIQANTKGCPKCSRPIEKNQGCNHMTCRVSSCGYNFCWVCLGDWATHGSATGGHYKCNKYEEVIKTNKNMQNEEKKREDAKNELTRYMFFYERFANHDKAERHGRELLPVIQSKIEML